MTCISTKNNVAVLLSSYNGALYLSEQIESLLLQEGELSIDIHIRDDGSTDNTREILKRYSDQYSNIFIYQGDNVGVIASFLWLVENINGYDYYAFCDQDDYWCPLKLYVAVSRLKKGDCDRPRLYCSAYDYVDKNLTTIGRYVSNSNMSANNLLIENCAPGCTMVFNEQLRQKYLEVSLSNVSNYVVMHDWFFLLLAVFWGGIEYDKNSYLLYRQHDNNVVGVANGFFAILKKRILVFLKEIRLPHHRLYLQMQLINGLFINGAGCNGDNFNICSKFISVQKNFLSRLCFIVNGSVHRTKAMDNLVFKILFLFGYYK